MPRPQTTGQQDEHSAISTRECRSFCLTTEHNQLLAQESIFEDQLGFTAGHIGDCSQQEIAMERLRPAFEALFNLLSEAEEALSDRFA